MEISAIVEERSKYLNLLDLVGEEIELKGVVFKVRGLSGFAFILVNAYGTIIQTVYTGEIGETGVKEGCSVVIKGKVSEAKLKDAFVEPKSCEVQINEINVVSSPKELLPFDITKKKLDIGNDLKFDLRYLSMRHPKEKAIFRIQSSLVQGIRSFLIENKFVEIRSPKIVAEGAEGGANIFSMDYFGQKAYLTQSPQFYKEFCVGVFDRVFEIAPVFRAEKHNTNRHINEYTSIDFEFGQIDSFYDILNMEAAMLKHAFEHLKKDVPYELDLLQVEVPDIKTIPALKFWEVKEIIKKEYKIDPKDSFDLAPIEEIKISDYVKKKYDSEFVFITHYPTAKRPFYAMDDAEDPELTVSFDLIFRGVEITTGGQRIHDFDQLVAKMSGRGMNPADFEFFTNAHKYGLPPHGGLGLGLERLTQRLLNVDNIKSATMFPRDMTRLTP
ncbi:MAG: aspartate--tRNA(Asn) ligase [Halobacteriovoraceae bacterium]|jgi:nondiscriminating aspartyl-tRNA synthetase|nr:aspartate--tRNA(Asn) ligase [Halobacteriovoraceae bacterium]MBT5093336.1 aspartate--tRNA(Asn) ligase [Halobacteriovoraceae bacterium]